MKNPIMLLLVIIVIGIAILLFRGVKLRHSLNVPSLPEQGASTSTKWSSIWGGAEQILEGLLGGEWAINR